MRGRRFLKTAPVILAAAILVGCGGTTANPMIKSADFQAGEADGCATAKGEYTKNSDLFRTDPDYEKGWFWGRKNCNPAFHQK